jgi:hypothetical protein
MFSTEKISKLAAKVQLEIKEEEMPVYMETLQQLEKLLVKFCQTKLPKTTKPLVRIDVGSLTRKDLTQLVAKFSQVKLNRQQKLSKPVFILQLKKKY